MYISTEAALPTARLSEMLQKHPRLASLPGDASSRINDFLARILTMQTPDLETQDHILRYQVPVAIERHNIGLIVIDSIASNYRAEFDQPTAGKDSPARRTIAPAMAERKNQLFQLGSYLRGLAVKEKVAIVVSNQVADRFDAFSSTPFLHVEEAGVVTMEPLTLDHQQRWFTGWGDTRLRDEQSLLKTPSLGLVWTNQIAARIALIKDSTVEMQKRRRWLRVVFSTWAAQSQGRGLEYEITAEGVRATMAD
jgi:DNA repair protein RAD57